MHCVWFGFVLEILMFNLIHTFFLQHSLMRRISWYKPNLHVKARRRDNDKAMFRSEYENFDDVKIDGHMASVAFKMSIFGQFGHALTRHDPKTC